MKHSPTDLQAETRHTCNQNGLLFVEPRAGKHYACVISPVQSCLIVSSLDFEKHVAGAGGTIFLGFDIARNDR